MNLLFLPVQAAVMAVFDFQQIVVVLTTEVVDKVETKKNRPLLSLGKASEETIVAKRPRTIMPNIIYCSRLECFNLAQKSRLRFANQL